MQSFVLQDWSTVGAVATLGIQSVTQSASGWLDLGLASEVLFYLEVANRSGSPRMYYETAPLRDAGTFKQLAVLNSALTVPSATPVVTRVSLYDNPAQPVSRWVRWRAWQDVGSPWDLTFRITVMAHAR